MNFASEFETVDLILASDAETRGVDAFALSLIKAERQLRKCFTHLIFQFSCFGPDEVNKLRDTLVSKRRVYFNGLEKGFNGLYPDTVEKLVGTEYTRLRPRLKEAALYRNKIFHGQLTDGSLSRKDLECLVYDIKTWCQLLATGANKSFEYDGFKRNSFQKSTIEGLEEKLKVTMDSVADYDAFIEKYMQNE